MAFVTKHNGMAADPVSGGVAGPVVCEPRRTDMIFLQRRARSADEAVALLQAADGALRHIGDKLNRMKKLAEQAAGNCDSLRHLALDSKFQALLVEIDRITATDCDDINMSSGARSMSGNAVLHLNIRTENLQAAESRISDAADAMKMTAFARRRFAVQSAVTGLLQAAGFAGDSGGASENSVDSR